MKRETAPTSDFAQFILARRSKDSVESAGNSQSEAQPGIGCNAIPEAALNKPCRQLNHNATELIDAEVELVRCENLRAQSINGVVSVCTESAYSLQTEMGQP